MKKVGRLFIYVFSFLVILTVHNSVFASCYTEHVYDEDQGMVVDKEVCDDTEPSGETPKVCPDGCCGIKLNTNFPIIGNCISLSEGQANPTNVFPTMMRALTRIIMSVILVVCFVMIIIAGIMRAGAGEDSSKKTAAKKIIERVAITILLLGFSGAILRLINPNFFG